MDERGALGQRPLVVTGPHAPEEPEPLLSLAVSLWIAEGGTAPLDEGGLLLDLEDASPTLRNPIVDALSRFGFDAFHTEVARALAARQGRA
jgi:hypothetical protein